MGGIIDIAGNSLATKKEKTLCTITFLYTIKGTANAERKKETIFAWIEEGSTNKDCVQLFEPKGSIKKQNCIIHEVIALPIQTVTHEED